MSKESFITIKSQVETSFVEKKSTFISNLAPVSSETEAIDFVNKIRKQYSDARHVVYAYIVNNDGVLAKRFSDDGEPSGTGGKPVLDVLEKNNLENVCITVTRYFGGILLGAPGLTRAYSTGCSDAVKNAETVKYEFSEVLSVEINYDLYGKIERLLSDAKFAVKKASPEFTDKVRLDLTTPVNEADKLQKMLFDATGAKIKITAVEKKYELYNNISL